MSGKKGSGSKWTAEQLLEMREMYVEAGRSAAYCAEHFGMTRSAFLGLADRQGWDHERNPAHKSSNNRKSPQALAPPREITLPADRTPTRHLAVDGPLQNPVFPGVTRCMWPDVPGDCKRPVARGAYCAEHGERAYVGRPPKGFIPKEAAQ